MLNYSPPLAFESEEGNKIRMNRDEDIVRE